MPIDRRKIMEILQTEAKVVGTSDTDIISSNVPEKTFRYIVRIDLIGDGVASRTVDIKYKDESGNYTTKFPMIPVPPADVRQIPQGSWDIENPILVLEGGTNLAGKVNAGAGVSLVVTWWDDEVL